MNFAPGYRTKSLSQENPLEEDMATHSCILAWEIPWTEEPGGLQSMGSQRAEHDCAPEPQGERKWQEPVKTASGLQFEVKGSQLPGGCGPCVPDLSFFNPTTVVNAS